MRRLRENETIREMVRETRLGLDDLIMPLFVADGLSKKQEIKSMPGQFRFPLNDLVDECRKLTEMGIKAVILFGIPAHKDSQGSGAFSEKGIIQRAVRALKEKVPEMFVITDLCLCEYTSHGHCGIVKGNRILNDPTLKILAKTAVSQAKAGTDMIAPSDMMDGRVGIIRKALDKNGFERIPIMAYSAKYASAFYGPFREAAESAPEFGDRKSYQMDPANSRMALREVELDVMEGADIVMVKPALAYLDIIKLVRENFSLPVAAYNVSGEYAMVKSAARKGWLDEKRIVMEILTSIKRAGADLILSYHSADVAKWLN
jgi:porphobilinogen synthase